MHYWTVLAVLFMDCDVGSTQKFLCAVLTSGCSGYVIIILLNTIPRAGAALEVTGRAGGDVLPPSTLLLLVTALVHLCQDFWHEMNPLLTALSLKGFLDLCVSNGGVK